MRDYTGSRRYNDPPVGCPTELWHAYLYCVFASLAPHDTYDDCSIILFNLVIKCKEEYGTLDVGLKPKE